ncbi:hypothetical protein QFZ53_000077 [Microbacterium natoriense]|uniref:Uncharacterized protein n=1 Tax=Microbacterium natoriense TaxID=284570 RepID=A0AAW8EQT1_9MICO|nr:hypothetical protein [Microbacterium natoriense]MDQ0645881.1 hypothetical protein [Microbacterium natoriense]
MFPDIIIGPIIVVLGVVLILLRRTVPGIFHAGLEFFYGAPLADDAIRPESAPRHIFIVGILFIVFGCIVTAIGLFGR